METKPNVDDIVLRRPRATDGGRVAALVRTCPPLDVNSEYCYLLLCSHFAATCTVAELDGKIVAFQTGYFKPEEPGVLFIWQIAVSEGGRGVGIAKRMIEDLFDSLPEGSVEYLEQTVTKSNNASRALFASVARDLNADLTESLLFGPDHFAEASHDPEYLLRIGPVAGHHAATIAQANNQQGVK